MCVRACVRADSGVEMAKTAKPGVTRDAWLERESFGWLSGGRGGQGGTPPPSEMADAHRDTGGSSLPSRTLARRRLDPPCLHVRTPYHRYEKTSFHARRCFFLPSSVWEHLRVHGVDARSGER